MTTTARYDTTTWLKGILDTYKAANPTLLRSAFRAHPANVLNTDLPTAWVEARTETVGHDYGVRTRTMTTSVVVADRLTDNVETMDRMDVLVDGLLDAFSAASPHANTQTVWNGGLSISDELEQFPDGTWVQQVRFTFGDVTAQEGRL